MQPVILPILEANMTQGIIRAWLKREGEVVQAGEPLFEVETDKVNAEVEAEVSGVLRHIAVPVGARAPVLSVLAFIGAADEAIPAPETWSSLVPPNPVVEQQALPTVAVESSAPAAAAPEIAPAVTTNEPYGTGSPPYEGGVRGGLKGRGAQPPPRPLLGKEGVHWPNIPVSHGSGSPSAAVASEARIAASPAARRLARERGIALEKIRPTGPRGEITRADVEAVVASATGTTGDGSLEPSFLALLRRDGGAIRQLSSEMKVRLYREHGAHIGEGVRIEPGALIIAPTMRIGAMSTIGADSTIECDRLQLGRLVAFGKRTRVRCRALEIGDALWSKDDVLIGGGGSEEAGARLRAGDACFFGEGAYLNTCHPLTLGNEVCIGARAMLFTHSHWQSILRGYASTFGPIQVGDHVFIGNNAFVFPGVTIGPGATVMVNSFVGISVPPDTFVGGVPAQVIRHIARPTREQQIALVRQRLMPEIATALEASGYQIARRDEGDAFTLDLGKGAAVQFVATLRPADIPRGGRVVILTFADDATPTVPPGATLLDLQGYRILGAQDALSDTIREFCRRRGIRFRPYAWRYRVGHFEGENFRPYTDPRQ